MPDQATVFYPSNPEFAVVPAYYAAAQYEPTPAPYGELSVSGSRTYSSFKDLVETIWNLRVSNPVVVTHGHSSYGMLMPLVPGGYSTGPCLQTLSLLVDYLQLVNYVGPGSTGLFDMGAAARFWDTWGVPASTALDLAQTCLQIRKSPNVCVTFHIRGCDIGVNPDANLKPVGRVFNSNYVSAPKSPMFYVHVVNPFVGNVDNWAKSHGPLGRRWRYKDATRPELILDIEYVGSTSHSQAAVVTRDAMGAWAQVMQKTASNPGNAGFIVAGLYPHDDDDYHLAHEAGYVSRIVQVWV